MPTTPQSRPTPRSRASVFGLIALGLGLVLVFVGYKSGAEERALSRHGRVAQGTIIDKRIDHTTRQKKGGGRDEQTLYVVRYVFPVGAGAGQEGEQAVDEAVWRSLRPESAVPIRYLPLDPLVSRLEAVPRSRMDPMLPVGGFLAVAGCAILTVKILKVRRP